MTAIKSQGVQEEHNQRDRQDAPNGDQQQRTQPDHDLPDPVP
jgi:hypothetical protein